MEQSKIDRINELARKSKTPEGLTEEERREQAELRSEYIASVKRSLVAQLDHTYLVDEKGNRRPLKRAPGKVTKTLFDKENE